MGKSNRAYKSAKRSKELLRQKKKEEKRLRRLAKDRKLRQDGVFPPDGETPESQNPES